MDDKVLMQALHDPENQPSQWGTVPEGWWLEALDMAARFRALLAEGLEINERASMRAVGTTEWMAAVRKELG